MLTQSPPYFQKLKDQSDQEVYKVNERHATIIFSKKSYFQIITDNYLKPAKHRLTFNSTTLIPQASTPIKELLDNIMDDDPFERPTAEEVSHYPQKATNKTKFFTQCYLFLF